MKLSIRTNDPIKAAAACLAVLRDDNTVRKATYYLCYDLVVKVSCIHKYVKRSRTSTFSVTVGQPNYAERAFVKAAKKAGEAFPVKRIQLKRWPETKK